MTLNKVNIIDYYCKLYSIIKNIQKGQMNEQKKQTNLRMTEKTKINIKKCKEGTEKESKFLV